MTSIRDAAGEFLQLRRIAVTGVSREPASHGGNIVYRHLRERGYDVVAINPNADEVEGDTCYQDLKTVPGGVDAVVIATRPSHAMGTMRECVELGIKHVWVHRAIGQGSLDPEAVAYGREQGTAVIDGGCPLMFDDKTDAGHKFLRFVCTMTGAVPRKV